MIFASVFCTKLVVFWKKNDFEVFKILLVVSYTFDSVGGKVTEVLVSLEHPCLMLLGQNSLVPFGQLNSLYSSQVTKATR